jgi:hypothetical protein
MHGHQFRNLLFNQGQLSRRRQVCTHGSVCADPHMLKRQRVVFWTVAILAPYRGLPRYSINNEINPFYLDPRRHCTVQKQAIHRSDISMLTSKDIRSAPHGIEDIQFSSDHVGAQAKRKNQAFSGFLATQASLKKTSKTPNIQRKVIT